DVAVLVEASDYQAVLDELAANKGATTLTLRRRLAAKAYARTAAYDAAISNWFARELKADAPDFRAFGGKLIHSLRYGENPHQTPPRRRSRSSPSARIFACCSPAACPIRARWGSPQRRLPAASWCRAAITPWSTISR